jgi:phenylacetate-CoA ligase
VISLPGYTTVLKRVLYPAYDRFLGRGALATLRERELSQYWSGERLRELQLTKLRAVLEHAGRHVPFYRRRFREAGFDPAQLTHLDQFGKLDLFVTKEVLQTQAKEFVSEACDPAKLVWHRSGGSTGEPVYFPTSEASDAASAAALFRAYGWFGVAVGDPHMQFWGSPRFIIRRPVDRLRKHTLGISHALMNRRFYPNYDLGEPVLRRCYQDMEQFRPQYLRGMASSLFLFARYLRDHGLEPIRAKPRVIVSGCEQLYDWERTTIEQSFKAPVMNTYGVSEFGEIAFEAPDGHLHTMDEDVFCELVPLTSDNDGPKELVVTRLSNLDSPLIRYRTGDIAERINAPGTTNGDIQLGSIEGLRGRAHDFIVTADGKFVHGQFFTHLVVFEPGIVKYQVVQETTDDYDIRLQVDAKYDRAAEARIAAGARSYLGEHVRIQFDYVDEIAPSAVGKHRWIISKVASRHVDDRT